MSTNFRNTPIENFQQATITSQNIILRSAFAWMSLAMVLTAISAILFAFIPDLASLLFEQNELGQRQPTILAYVVMLAPLLFVIAISYGIKKMTMPVLVSTFVAFSIVMGMSLSSIFYRYEIGSIYKVFLSTTGLFAVMAIAGYTTKTDLTKLGSLLMIGLIGIIIASIINWFMHSGKMDYIISILGVIIFTGFTAYDVQKIKNAGEKAGNSADSRRIGIIGALELYLDFINLFLFLLRLFGGRKN